MVGFVKNLSALQIERNAERQKDILKFYNIIIYFTSIFLNQINEIQFLKLIWIVLFSTSFDTWRKYRATINIALNAYRRYDLSIGCKHTSLRPSLNTTY